MFIATRKSGLYVMVTFFAVLIFVFFSYTIIRADDHRNAPTGADSGNLNQSLTDTTADFTSGMGLPDIKSVKGISYDTPLELVSSASEVVIGQEFTVTINVKCAEGQPVAGADAFLNFDPVHLEALSITPNLTKLGTQANLNIDNTSGCADYSALKSEAQPTPTGAFPIATVTFKAKTKTDKTTVTFSLSAPRMSCVAYGEDCLAGTHTNTDVVIGDGTVIFTAKLQGGQRPAPVGADLKGYNIPLTLKAFPTSKTLDSSNILTEPAQYTLSTAGGQITITGVTTGTKTITCRVTGLPVGTYHLSLCTPHCLINLRQNYTIVPGTAIDMGTLLEGNSDYDITPVTSNQTQIFGSDFNMLLSDYLQMPGGDKWNNGRSDFDRNGQVNSVDFSVLVLNYTMSSPNIVN